MNHSTVQNPETGANGLHGVAAVLHVDQALSRGLGMFKKVPNIELEWEFLILFTFLPCIALIVICKL